MEFAPDPPRRPVATGTRSRVTELDLLPRLRGERHRFSCPGVVAYLDVELQARTGGGTGANEARERACGASHRSESARRQGGLVASSTRRESAPSLAIWSLDGRSRQACSSLRSRRVRPQRGSRNARPPCPVAHPPHRFHRGELAAHLSPPVHTAVVRRAARPGAPRIGEGSPTRRDDEAAKGGCTTKSEASRVGRPQTVRGRRRARRDRKHRQPPTSERSEVHRRAGVDSWHQPPRLPPPTALA